MKITTYSISAPYWINGHQNESGLAIAAEINDKLMATGESTDLDSVQYRFSDVDQQQRELYGLTIEATEIEIDE